METELLAEVLEKVIRTSDSKFSKDAVETLLTIHRNILHDEDKVKYRKIKKSNPAFQKKIWSTSLLQNFMYLAGWREINGFLVFNKDENLLGIIEAILKYRNIHPSQNEWISSTKYEGQSEAQLKEEELRKKAALEREKELEEFYKDKKYREELAANVKKEISEDRKRRRLIYRTPVVLGQSRKYNFRLSRRFGSCCHTMTSET